MVALTSYASRRVLAHGVRAALETRRMETEARMNHFALEKSCVLSRRVSALDTRMETGNYRFSSEMNPLL